MILTSRDDVGSSTNPCVVGRLGATWIWSRSSRCKLQHLGLGDTWLWSRCRSCRLLLCQLFQRLAIWLDHDETRTWHGGGAEAPAHRRADRAVRATQRADLAAHPR